MIDDNLEYRLSAIEVKLRCAMDCLCRLSRPLRRDGPSTRQVAYAWTQYEALTKYLVEAHFLLHNTMTLYAANGRLGMREGVITRERLERIVAACGLKMPRKDDGK
jgi:hypothetical protein